MSDDEKRRLDAAIKAFNDELEAKTGNTLNTCWWYHEFAPAMAAALAVDRIDRPTTDETIHRLIGENGQ